MQLYLVRHGLDLATRPGYLSGEDVALSEAGKQQAAACAGKLATVLNGAQLQIISSPRRHTMQTAEIIAASLGTEPQTIRTDTRLAERDCAAFFGKLAAEVFDLSEAELERGGMEAYDSLYRKLESLYAETLPSDKPVLFVTHSGNIRPLLQLAHGVPPDPTGATPDLPADDYLQLH